MLSERASATRGVTIAVLITSTFFVSLRFISKGWVLGKLTPDDWLILLAWIFAFGFSFSICYATSVGLGEHTSDIRTSWNVPLQTADYALTVLYQPTLMATKTSIIIFFLSFAKEEMLFRRCNYITLFVVNAAGVGITFTSIFQCSPFNAPFQYPPPKSAKCLDIVALFLSSAPVNVSTDLALLFLPMPILTRLRLPRKQKIILLVTFGTGVFVAAVDIVRIASLQTAAIVRTEILHGGGSTNDPLSWYAALSFMWSAVEVNVGIIVACVPSLKPLFLRFLPSWIRDDGSSYLNDSSLSSQSRRATVVDENTNLAASRQGQRSMSAADGDDDGDVDFFQFLATEPDGSTRHPSAAVTTTTRHDSANPRPQTFFDFVNMAQSRNMLQLSNRESLIPLSMVTVIFLVWGVAYGFLNVLDSRFAMVLPLSESQTLGPHISYYAGYFIGPLTLGQYVLRYYGFKATMIVGLLVYSVGVLIFWPAAVLVSYPAYIVSNVIVGIGLSNLESAANPFIALCGPLEYAEIRLNISQGIQAIGTLLSPILAEKVLFKNVDNAPSLVDVQWTFLAIALFDMLLALALHYVRLPEASDADFEEFGDRQRRASTAKIGGKFPVIWVTLALGVFSQWCYVGGQESIGTNTSTLRSIIQTTKTFQFDSFDFSTVAHAVFAIGRFLTAFLNYLFLPRWILLGLYVGVVVFSALTMTLSGTACLIMLLFVYVSESGIFSIIFAMTLRGMGAHTKIAAACITAAISGGAVFPVIQNAVLDGQGVQYSFCVPTAVFAFGLIYPLYLNLVPHGKKQVDPVHETQARYINFPRSRRSIFRTLSFTSATSNPNTNLFGLKGILARHRRRKATRSADKETHNMTIGPVKQRCRDNASPSEQGSNGSGTTAVELSQDGSRTSNVAPEVILHEHLREIDPANLLTIQESKPDTLRKKLALGPLRLDDDTDHFVQSFGQGRLGTPVPGRGHENQEDYFGPLNSSAPSSVAGGLAPVPKESQNRRVSFANVPTTQDQTADPLRNSSLREQHNTQQNGQAPAKEDEYSQEIGKDVHDFAN